MNIIKVIMLAVVISLSFGCSTLIGVAEDTCETALGGSKVGDDLCAKIGVLKSDEE